MTALIAFYGMVMAVVFCSIVYNHGPDRMRAVARSPILVRLAVTAIFVLLSAFWPLLFLAVVPSVRRVIERHTPSEDEYVRNFESFGRRSAFRRKHSRVSRFVCSVRGHVLVSPAGAPPGYVECSRCCAMLGIEPATGGEPPR